tara:strand:- start:3336 stop:4127 length:792 start_codon:yes stop_codon:yes gene_type:complete
MKKNVIWWPALNNPNHSDKYGGFGYFEHSRKAWEYWCKKNDCLFVPFTEPVENDFTKFRPQWQKCLFVFDELERMGIEYDQIALVDSTATPHWDCPNFFELTDRKFTAFRDMDNLKWVYESVEGYNDMFEPFIFDMSKYFNSGFMIFNEKHKQIFTSLKEFYYENMDDFIQRQDVLIKKGNDQTPINFWVQMSGVEINLDLPFTYNLTHLHRKEMLRNNWQLNEDQTPMFIKYGYVWRLTGIPKDQRTILSNQIWDLVGKNYE